MALPEDVRSAAVCAMHDAALARRPTPAGSSPAWEAIADNHRFNCLLWDEEDLARRRAVPDAVTLPQYFMRHGWRAEGMGKIFHIGHGNVGDEASWSVPFIKDNVVDYALPASTDGGKLRLQGDVPLTLADFAIPDPSVVLATVGPLVHLSFDLVGALP